jgi:hypothetical protein
MSQQGEKNSGHMPDRLKIQLFRAKSRNSRTDRPCRARAFSTTPVSASFRSVADQGLENCAVVTCTARPQPIRAAQRPVGAGCAFDAVCNEPRVTFPRVKETRKNCANSLNHSRRTTEGQAGSSAPYRSRPSRGGKVRPARDSTTPTLKQVVVRFREFKTRTPVPQFEGNVHLRVAGILRSRSRPLPGPAPSPPSKYHLRRGSCRSQ